MFRYYELRGTGLKLARIPSVIKDCVSRTTSCLEFHGEHFGHLEACQWHIALQIYISSSKNIWIKRELFVLFYTVELW
jgi:hypothetical protein